MAVTLSDKITALSKRGVINPSLVLDVEGVETIFTCVRVKRKVRIGEPGYFIGGDWVIGATTDQENQRQIISLEGTTTQIQQQLLQDKGGTSSASTMQVSLVDVGGIATRLVSPGVVVDEILGRKARIWLSFAEGAFPSEYMIIFQGIITAVDYGANIVLTIASPEVKKNQEVFTKTQVKLSGAHNNSVTTLLLDSVDGLITPNPSEGLQCYVRVDDELIEYDAIDEATNSLTGCTRAQLTSVANAHDDQADVQSFYRLQGNGLELALKVLLSGKNGPWVEDISAENFVELNPYVGEVVDAIYFPIDIITKYGVTVGSLCSITGASNPANNVTEVAVTSVINLGRGSYVILDGPGLVVETGSDAVASFRSQYDVLGEGAAFGQNEVDIDEFERLIDLFNSAMPDFDFYLKDSITVREFVDTEILFPTGAYSIPRKGKVSVGFTSPPLAIANVPNIDSTQIVRPDKIKISRSIGKYFYNVAVFRYDIDSLEDKYLAGRVTVDGDALSRIPVGSRPLTITSRGLRNNATTSEILDLAAQRFMERYRFAAELVKAQVQYGVGFQIEVGDVVVFGDETLAITDSKSGARGFTPRLMEVVNKTMNIKTGEVNLDLLDTSYLNDGRYGIFSPSSIVDSGSTTTSIKITDSFGLDIGSIESDKWRSYIGYNIIVHDPEWTTSYETMITGISTADPYKLEVSTMGGIPAAGWIVDILDYDDSEQQAQTLPKALHCFWTPQIPVVTGVSGTQLTIDAGDVSKLSAGAKVIVHNDWLVASEEVFVDSIAGTTVTLRTDIGFTPDSTYFLDLVGFQDGGAAYRWL